MGKALLIAEKPSLMIAIQSVYNKHKNEFSDEIDFIAQAGHLVGLKNPKEINAEKYGKWNIANFPEEYPFEYKILDGKADLIRKIKNAVTKGNYDYIIHAGDPEPEGELLVRLVLDYVGNKLPVKRFWSNDTTEGGILSALSNLQPDANFDHIYESALVRQHADYQFGMNCTGTLSCKTGDLCRIGRVKAPIISIIAKRELEIRNYVEKKTYKPAFRYKGCEFVKNEAFDTSEDALKGVPKTEYANVIGAKYEQKSVKAPALFKLSTLQTEANKQFGWKASKTLKVLQNLYEAKAVSYPRTGCEYISSRVDIGGIARRVLGEIPVDTALLVREPSDVIKDKSYANDKAISTEGHTAVIPTGQGLHKGASKDETALYEIICRRFLAIFGPAKEVMKVKVTANPSGTKDDYVFSESYDIKPGYEEILNPGYKMRSGSGVTFKNGQSLHPIEFFAKELVSQKPPRYNEGSLIQLLDKFTYESEEGKYEYMIGTSATRANIIDECIANGYFHAEKKSFVADEKAIAIYEGFGDVPLFQPVESGRWEEMLDHIRKGTADYKEIEEQLFHKMEESVDLIKEGKVVAFETNSKAGGHGPVCTCPNCQSAVKKGQYGLYCSGKCGMTFGKVFGKSLTESEWKKVLGGDKVLLKGLESKRGYKYNAYVKADGIEDYSYTRKDGTKASGKQIHFDMEYER